MCIASCYLVSSVKCNGEVNDLHCVLASVFSLMQDIHVILYSDVGYVSSPKSAFFLQ